MPDIMTESELAELRALEAAATPGPWTDDARGHWGDMPRIYGDGFLIAVVGNAQPERGDQWDDDAKFIRAARNAVPRLLMAPDAERAENARLREALEWYGAQAQEARLIHGGGDNARFALADDGGARARAALKGGDADA